MEKRELSQPVWKTAKGILVNCGQMFGSGKTEIVKKAINALKKYPEKLKILQDTFGEELLSRYLSAHYVYVDLEQKPMKRGKISGALAAMLIRA
jgi:Ni2+-binding GTPase involved in maturation of urease and hydrogenase